VRKVSGGVNGPVRPPQPPTIVTVNRGVIDSNRKRGKNEPPVRAARGKYGRVVYGHVIKLNTHGARVWVETTARAEVVR